MAVAVVVIYRDVAMNEGLAVSALRPEADIWAGLQHVCFVPLPDIADGYTGSSSTPENSKWPE
jgi:hypothetical protein